jgi:hypothetical protein
MWCGLPVVALHDGMGVSQQVLDGESGILVMPASDQEFANWRFGSEAVALLRNRARREALAAGAERAARVNSDPGRCLDRYYQAFREAREHLQETRAHCRAPSRFLARWTALQAAAVGFGCIRPPAVVNRHGRKQPHWEAMQPEPSSSRPSSIVVPVSASPRLMG